MHKKVVFFLIILLTGRSFSEGKEVFNLERALEVALKNNLQIKQEQEKIYWAKNKVYEAKSYKYPQLSFVSSYTRLNKPSVMELSFPTPPLSVYTIDSIEQGALTQMGALTFSDYLQKMTGQVSPLSFSGNYIIPPQLISHKLTLSGANVYNAKVDLQQMIYTFGKIETAIKLSKCNLKSQELEVDKKKSEIIFEVKRAYYGVLQAKNFVKVALQAVGTLKEHLKVVKNLEKEGVASGYDVLKVEVALSAVEQNLIAAENGEKMSKMGLAILLGGGYRVEKIEVEEIDNFILEDKDLNLDELIQEGLTNRKEVLQMKENIEMAQGNVKLTKLHNKPSLVLVGNYEFKEDDDTWNTTLALNFPFFDSGQTRTKTRQAISQLKSANIGLLQINQLIDFEITESYLNLNVAKKKIEVAKRQVAQAEEGLRIAQERYREGIGTSVEVMDGETALTQAWTSYYNSIHEYRVATAKLEKTTGRE